MRKYFFILGTASLVSWGGFFGGPVNADSATDEGLIERRQSRAREIQEEKWSASELFKKKQQNDEEEIREEERTFGEDLELELESEEVIEGPDL